MSRLLFQYLSLLNKLAFAFTHNVFLPAVVRAIGCFSFRSNVFPNFIKTMIESLDSFLDTKGVVSKPFISFFEFKVDFFFECEGCLQFV